MRDRGFPGLAKDPSATRAFLGCAALALVPLVLGLAGVIVVASVLPHGACGCASTPTRPPGWTPWPVSRDQAVDTASRLTQSRIERGWTYERTVFGNPMYQAQGTNAVAYVDADSGAVAVAVIADVLPDSTSVAVSADAATSGATSYLAQAGINATGLSIAARLIHGPVTAYYDVSLTGEGASRPGLEVLVNASSGRVFAYRDLRAGIKFAIPVISQGLAVKLAGQATVSAGSSQNPGDNSEAFQHLYDNLGSGGAHSWEWEVTLSNGVFGVDGETGEVWTIATF